MLTINIRISKRFYLFVFCLSVRRKSVHVTNHVAYSQQQYRCGHEQIFLTIKQKPRNEGNIQVTNTVPYIKGTYVEQNETLPVNNTENGYKKGTKITTVGRILRTMILRKMLYNSNFKYKKDIDIDRKIQNKNYNQ